MFDFGTADGSITLDRLYNSRSYSGSRNELASMPIGLGNNWRFWFQHELQLNQSTGERVELETAGGTSYPFDRESNGAMSAQIWLYGPRKQTDYSLAFVGTWPPNLADVLNSGRSVGFLLIDWDKQKISDLTVREMRRSYWRRLLSLLPRLL